MFGPRMVCTRCGIIGAEARPNWQEQPQSESLTGVQMAVSGEQRRALRLLAGSPLGATEAIVLAHSFKNAMLDALVRDGLATAERCGRDSNRSRLPGWRSPTPGGRRSTDDALGAGRRNMRCCNRRCGRRWRTMPARPLNGSGKGSRNGEN